VPHGNNPGFIIRDGGVGFCTGFPNLRLELGWAVHSANWGWSRHTDCLLWHSGKLGFLIKPESHFTLSVIDPFPWVTNRQFSMIYYFAAELYI